MQVVRLLAGARRRGGLPAWLAQPAGVLLPLLAVVLAGDLLWHAWAGRAAHRILALCPWALAGGGYPLAHELSPARHCSGLQHAAPAGWPAPLHLAMQVVASLRSALGPHADVPHLSGWFTLLALPQRVVLVLTLLGLALVLGEGWVLWQLLRQHGRVLLRLDALEAERAAGGPTPRPTRDNIGASGPVPPASSSALSPTTTASLRGAATAPAPAEAEDTIELTIGMATYNDFDGVYFTLQALRLNQDLGHTELLVVDN